MEHRFFRVADALRQTYTVRKEGHRFLVRMEGKEVEASTVALGEHRFLLRLPDRQLVVDWARKDKEIFLQIDGPELPSARGGRGPLAPPTGTTATRTSPP